ncbi:MAG: tRNA (N6-isopentenyl adenosine(37)-C2)-methylthiotransferase MiaB [Spirochaetes bacterium]|nr:tRNA (N6-isopentenyl adenosine(37)-C2)-methylthiotransferase MiaB [Spirochaetota bacterium]
MENYSEKSYHIETFGCQMNKNDSELISLSLSRAGYAECASANEADIIVFNTCSVRQHAEDRVISRIGALKNRRKNKSIIVIAGCMAQRIAESLTGQNIADIAIGPYESPRIGEIVEQYFSGRDKTVYNSQLPQDFNTRIDPGLAEKKDSLPWHKWVTITHGCENFCSYCIVPYVRGPLISFPSDSIIAYIKTLANSGTKEITLLGQNVNQYGTGCDIPFYKLMERAAGINGIERINFLTSHPKDFDENIVYVIRDNKNISRAVHLPLQSGSDTVLSAMNRKYDTKHYLGIVDKINAELKTFSLSTDIIVGFPGETEKDFTATLDIVKRVRFDDAFMYAYSPREGTAAFKLEECLSRDMKIERLNRLIELQRGISREKLSARINMNEEMIAERISKKSGNELMGKTFLNHPVIIPGVRDDIGKKIRIRITGLKGNTLYGTKTA